MSDETNPGGLTYRSYLELDRLLTCQRPRSVPPHPDELHFIVTHQAIELWFRLVVDDVRRARDALVERRWGDALAVMRRAGVVTDVTTAQMLTLMELPPPAFHQFRPFLGTASGLESVQFRRIEVLSGLRDPAYLDRLRETHAGRLPVEVARDLSESSLADAHRAAGAQEGIVDWDELYDNRGHDPMVYLFSEALLDYDRSWQRWRAEHLALVGRMLGGQVMGTGRTTDAYLRGRLDTRFFPHLWQARSALALRAGGIRAD
ncbi:hypothetical protein KIF24_20605 [Micromonospora sp. Llam7]|uniref:tryptophan 2,3-dioxygenase family protein n=1 Tax=Micromonospora tarapacensis TaxID=2835305 RepID=UPI001C83191E|nr:tryptophan 2,3-dioxygenase family protein [Micromonospora tarapacensis]MBX7268192.1 hypothetical protein [Micromonospora tarapacensis]